MRPPNKILPRVTPYHFVVLFLRFAKIDVSVFLIAIVAGATHSFAQLAALPKWENTNGVRERIHSGDIVDVDVVGSLEFDWRGGLTPEGFLDGPPYIDRPIFALCRTEEETARSIEQELARTLRQPRVVVTIVDRSKRALAFVTGAVRNPSRLQLRRPLPLNELIVLVGGITERSNGDISVFRPASANCAITGSENAQTAESVTMIVKISDLLAGAEAANMSVLGGDIIQFLESAPVFVVTPANSTVRLNLTPEMTLLRALSAAGAVNLKGSQKVRIHRRGTSAGPIELEYRAIKEKKAEDPRLEPFDVVLVDDGSGASQKLAPITDRDDGVRARNTLPLKIVD